MASVCGQTHQYLEVIVVDDGSVDDTYSIAEALRASDPRIKVLRHERSRGAQAARNTGILNALGVWVGFLDSDDVYLPNSIRWRLEVAERDRIGAVHSECTVLRGAGSRERLNTPPWHGDIRRQVLAYPGPTFPGLLVRRQCLNAIGGLDESIVAFQEWDTAIRLAFVTRFGFVPEPTFIWDQRGSDTISNDLRRSAAGYEQVVRKHVRSIVRHGGPRMLAGHFREAARQRRMADEQSSSMMREAVALVVWPPGVLAFGRKVIRRVIAAVRRPFAGG